MMELNQCNILKLPFKFRPPLRPRTSYAFFVKDNYRRWMRLMGTRDHVEVIHALANRWKKIPHDEKELFDQMAKDDRRLRYKWEMIIYLRKFNGRQPRMIRRKRKAKGLPKRPRNPFIFFQLEMWGQVRREIPSMTQQQTVKEIEKRWMAMSTEERLPYKQMNVQDRNRYMRELRDYRKRRIHERAQNRIEKQRIRLIALRARYGEAPLTALESGIRV